MTSIKTTYDVWWFNIYVCGLFTFPSSVFVSSLFPQPLNITTLESLQIHHASQLPPLPLVTIGIIPHKQARSRCGRRMCVKKWQKKSSNSLEMALIAPRYWKLKQNLAVGRYKYTWWILLEWGSGMDLFWCDMKRIWLLHDRWARDKGGMRGAESKKATEFGYMIHTLPKQWYQGSNTWCFTLVVLVWNRSVFPSFLESA